MSKIKYSIGSIICIVFLYLVIKLPYASGYMSERSTIWGRMRAGYQVDQGEWSFGYFVPFIVAGLFGLTWKRWLGCWRGCEKSWVGGVILFIAFFIYFGGYKANEKFVGYASLQLLVAGIVIFFLGIRFFGKAFWLWVLLGMMWPWTFLIEPISFPLQKIMSQLTYGALRLIGEDVIKDGTAVMSAPSGGMAAGERFSLKVAAPCSGLRSLFALVMISISYGYWLLKSNSKVLVMFLMAVPLAVLGNFVRMMILYVGTISFGSEFAIGRGEHDPSTYHIMAGLMVFVIALFGMFAIGHWLSPRKKQLVKVTKK